MCATLRQSRQGVKPTSHQLVLYCAITMYQHLFLDQYLYFLSIHDLKTTLKVRCQCIVIAQHNKNWWLVDLTPRWLSCRLVHTRRNTYTSPDDVTPCAKSKVFVTVAGNWANPATCYLLINQSKWVAYLNSIACLPYLLAHTMLFVQRWSELISEFCLFWTCHISSLPSICNHLFGSDLSL